jgi:hypothetical protein
VNFVLFSHPFFDQTTAGLDVPGDEVATLYGFLDSAVTTTKPVLLIAGFMSRAGN